MVWNAIENHFEVSRIVKFSHDSINLINSNNYNDVTTTSNNNEESNLMESLEYLKLNNNTRLPNKISVSSIIGIETMIHPVISDSIRSKDNSLEQLEKVINIYVKSLFYISI